MIGTSSTQRVQEGREEMCSATDPVVGGTGKGTLLVDARPMPTCERLSQTVQSDSVLLLGAS